MDSRKIRLKVEFYPHLKNIKVFSNKILAPAKISKIENALVDYKAPPSLPIMVLGFISIIILISALPLLGFLSLILIPIVAILIFTIDNRRKASEIAWLKRILPEQNVIKYVRLSIKECLKKNVEKIEIKDDKKDVVLIVTCGYPINRSKRFYNLALVLKARRSITLEHAVAGKFLIVPRMRRKVDSQDVADALAFGADVKKVVDIINKVLEEYPEFAEVVANNIQEVEEHLKYYTELDPLSVDEVRYKLRYILGKVSIPEELKSRVNIFVKS